MRCTGGEIFYMNVTSSLIFLGLAGWLFWSAQASVFSTWSDKVVLGKNETMSSSIATLNASLTGLCTKNSAAAAHTAPRLSIPPLFFSLNGSRIDGTVFATRTNTTYDSISLLAMVFFISLGFQIWRVAFSADEQLDHQSISSEYSSCEASQRRLFLVAYTENKPDFAWWIEYALTAPLQIIIICSSVYIRNAEQLSLISALQGGLTLCGWTVEILIFHLEISANDSGRFSSAFNEILSKFSAIFLTAVYMHYVIWSTILSFYYSHEANLRECECDIDKFPPILRDMVVLQCVLFSCFGVVPLIQVAYILIAPPAENGKIQLTSKITNHLFTYCLNCMCKSNPVCLIHQWSVIFLLASYVQ